MRKFVLTAFATLLVAAAGASPAGHAVAAEIWVTNMTSATVSVIDPDKMSVIATIPAGKGCHNVAFSPDGKWAAVAQRRRGHHRHHRRRGPQGRPYGTHRQEGP